MPPFHGGVGCGPRSLSDFTIWDWRRETDMVSRQSIWRRKRCAEDPEYQEKERAICRAWWAANKDECNARRRAKRYKGYGISDEDYRALLARQGGRCGICMKKKRPLCVDHCHVTGRCAACFATNAISAWATTMTIRSSRGRRRPISRLRCATR